MRAVALRRSWPWLKRCVGGCAALLLLSCGQAPESPPTGARAGSAAVLPEQAAGSAAPAAPVVLYYYDPMHPETHFDRPGKSPFMDMELVPKYAAVLGAGGVVVSAAVIQTLGIRTALPVRRHVHPTVRAPAQVLADARSQARLQSRVSGWIEKLTVRSVGQTVVAGSVVAEIYSPELVQAQTELLLGSDTAAAAAERLRRFGIADRDIEAVRRTGQVSRRLPLRAPVSGVVTELGVREGSTVSPDTLLADFSARDAVWVEAQLFPAQLAELGTTLTARFTLPGVSGREWRADQGSVLPLANATTQTLTVRFAVNPARGLSLGAWVEAEIRGAVRSHVLLLPTSAVIRTAQGSRVLVEQAGKRFVPQAVTLGPRYGDAVEILTGLTGQEQVVVSGQFLLDAEANVSSGLEQMSETAPAGPPP